MWRDDWRDDDYASARGLDDAGSPAGLWSGLARRLGRELAEITWLAAVIAALSVAAVGLAVLLAGA